MSAYLAYLVAETVNMSGIVALFFTAICHAHYAFYSVAEEAKIALKRCFEFAAFLSETFVFAFLGLQVGGFLLCIVAWPRLDVKYPGIPIHDLQWQRDCHDLPHDGLMHVVKIDTGGKGLPENNALRCSAAFGTYIAACVCLTRNCQHMPKSFERAPQAIRTALV